MDATQKILDSLQPYLISIRYLEGIPVLDIVLKDGWIILDEINDIKKVKGGDEKLNYFMIFSENKSINLSSLLAYVDKTIKINLEREKKHELLRIKVNQLKELFKKTSLSKLEKLKFTFGEEDFMTNISDIDDMSVQPIKKLIQPIDEIIEEDVEEPVTIEKTQASINQYLDEDGKPIELSDEDKELAAEEARAQKNIRILENRKLNQKPNNLVKKIELPPKRKVVMANDMNYGSDCECSETEACDKCIDSKDF